MLDLSNGAVLFYIGIAGMIIAAISAVVSVIVFFVSGKRIMRKLEDEYGKKNV